MSATCPRCGERYLDESLAACPFCNLLIEKAPKAESLPIVEMAEKEMQESLSKSASLRKGIVEETAEVIKASVYLLGAIVCIVVCIVIVAAAGDAAGALGVIITIAAMLILFFLFLITHYLQELVYNQRKREERERREE